MTTAFTPGPWIVDRRDDAVAIRGECNEGVAEICNPAIHRHGLVDPAERKANARLIAAAPDMYEALKNAVHALQYCLNHHMPDDEMLRPKCQKNIDAARAALAKVQP